MKILSDVIRQNGILCTLIVRKGRKCLFERHNDEKSNSFEVFIPRIRKKEKILKKIKYKQREVYPIDEDFGYSAKSYSSLENALNGFDKMKGLKLTENERNIIKSRY